ncbi:hypothetical protein OG280_26370 [Streptomyces virginiae]|uniref:hypothetical protein n=1 Tax=Streptomyces virginiae TaxID=1961 RepID=UPI0032491EC7
MGFDIYIQDTDGTFKEGDDNYFRLSWTQGHSVFDTMSHFGMVVEREHPNYPLMPAYGLEGSDFAPDAQLTPEKAVAIDAYKAAYIAVRDEADDEPTAIRHYKLYYNDGCLVTPKELGAAIAAYESHPHWQMAELPVGDPLWPRWMTFLRRARDAGGLRVH